MLILQVLFYVIAKVNDYGEVLKYVHILMLTNK